MSSKLKNVLYDVWGAVVDEAAHMEENGLNILKLNISNPAPFGFRASDEIIGDMRDAIAESQGYSDHPGGVFGSQSDYASMPSSRKYPM